MFDVDSSFCDREGLVVTKAIMVSLHTYDHHYSKNVVEIIYFG